MTQISGYDGQPLQKERKTLHEHEGGDGGEESGVSAKREGIAIQKQGSIAQVWYQLLYIL